MTDIHCISGLGADHRIFQRINIPGVRLIPVPWVPFDKHDELPCYAQKMADQISGEQPVIIGLSFGGMLAAEIARIRPVKKIFLVSSAKDATEIPPVGGFARFLVDNGLIPVKLARVAGKQLYDRFGAETVEERKMLADILRQTDGAFTRWALKAIMEWRTRIHAENIVHIHGTADRMLLPQYIKPTHWIEGGTHLMIYQRADEISRLIAGYL